MAGQITISLNTIEKNRPCADGWKTIVEARGGLAADFDEEFPLSAALESNGLDDVLWATRCLPEHANLWRKYVMWCAEPLLSGDPDGCLAMIAAQKYIDGLITEKQLQAVYLSMPMLMPKPNPKLSVINWCRHVITAPPMFFNKHNHAINTVLSCIGLLLNKPIQSSDMHTKFSNKMKQILDAGCWVD